MAHRGQGDVILGWLVPAPDGHSGGPLAGVGSGLALDGAVGGLAGLLRSRGGVGSALALDGAVQGLAGLLRSRGGWPLFQGFIELEGLEEGRDYLGLGHEEALAGEVVLLKQELFTAFLCRLWARERACEAVRLLLAEGSCCPFDVSLQPVELGSGEAIASHYLELVLGRGRKASCPQAEKYLQGVARDMTLEQQPYLCSILMGRGNLRATDTVLSIFLSLGGQGDIPLDLLEDLALAVAAKALELVQVLGLDL